MIQFISTCRYDIKGRGTVLGTKSHTDNLEELHLLLGQIVSVDGVEYTVRGIERHATARVRVGGAIGLLVEPLNSEQ